MHPNVQSEQVWENWPFKTVGLAAVVSVARPGEALAVSRVVSAVKNPSQVAGNIGRKMLSIQACVGTVTLGMNSSHTLDGLIL